MDKKIQASADLKEFERLEKICILGRTTFYLVGTAFDTIKRAEMYRLKGFKTVGAWAESIGYSHQHINRLIRDKKALDSLPPGMRELVSDERGAHELAKFPEPLRLAILAEATQGGQKPASGAEIKKHSPLPPPRQKPSSGNPGANAKPLPKRNPVPTAPKVKPTLDHTEFPVPPECLPLWKSGGDVQGLLTYLSSIRSTIKTAEENQNKLWAEVNFGSVLSLVNQLYSEIECARPYAVCPTCNGITFDSCSGCRGRGFVSKFYWSTCVPEETKAMRKVKQ